MWQNGETIIVTDRVNGKKFAAWPHQVIEDRWDELRLLLTPGTQGLAPKLWIEALQTKDDSKRLELLDAYARDECEMGTWVWQHNTRLAIIYSDRYYAIEPMWTESGRFRCWYVNFQLPFVRTRDGVDTCDLHLDLIVEPDFSYTWKDEDEYSYAIGKGLVPDEWQANIKQAQDQVLELIHARQGPFKEDWSAIPRKVPAGRQP